MMNIELRDSLCMFSASVSEGFGRKDRIREGKRLRSVHGRRRWTDVVDTFQYTMGPLTETLELRDVHPVRLVDAN